MTETIKIDIPKEACSNCRCWLKHDGGNSGWCRRYPPTAVWDSEGRADSYTPSTTNDDWCGEWRPAPR